MDGYGVEVAEEEGFEPPIPFQVRQFSRLEPSTTRPLFLSEFYYADAGCAKSSSKFQPWPGITKTISHWIPITFYLSMVGL